MSMHVCVYPSIRVSVHDHMLKVCEYNILQTSILDFYILFYYFQVLFFSYSCLLIISMSLMSAFLHSDLFLPLN